MKRTLDAVDELQLSHRENIFTIQYAALDFTAPSDIQYAYMLDGFEKTWNYVGKQRTATYTNLPKGHYVFKVRSTNADGVWSDNIRTLDIEVLPSFGRLPLPISCTCFPPVDYGDGGIYPVYHLPTETQGGDGATAD